MTKFNKKGQVKNQWFAIRQYRYDTSKNKVVKSTAKRSAPVNTKLIFVGIPFAVTHRPFHGMSEVGINSDQRAATAVGGGDEDAGGHGFQ